MLGDAHRVDGVYFLWRKVDSRSLAAHLTEALTMGPLHPITVRPPLNANAPGPNPHSTCDLDHGAAGGLRALHLALGSKLLATFTRSSFNPLSRLTHRLYPFVTSARERP